MSIDIRYAILGLLPKPQGTPLTAKSRYQISGYVLHTDPAIDSRRAFLGILPVADGGPLDKQDRLQVLGYPRVRSSATIIYSGTNIRSRSSLVISTYKKNIIQSGFRGSSSLRHSGLMKIYSSTNIHSVSKCIGINKNKIRSLLNIISQSSLQARLSDIVISRKSIINIPSNTQTVIVFSSNIQTTMNLSASITDEGV